jgi:hypothetical protein
LRRVESRQFLAGELFSFKPLHTPVQ